MVKITYNMSSKKELVGRRAVIQGGSAFLAGLALMHKDGTALVQAVEMLSPQSAFRTPDSIFSSPLAIPDFNEGGQDFSWGPMNFTSRVIQSEPVAIEGDLAFKPLIKSDLVLEAPLTLVITRLLLNQGGVGITHLLPGSDRDQASVELKPNGDMRAIVRKGINGEDASTSKSIGSIPSGTSEFYLAMMLSNSGTTFGAFSPDGILRNEIDLEAPTVEVGQPSTLIAYTFGKGASAEVLSTIIASQKTK